jgi:hypothetical protein
MVEYARTTSSRGIMSGSQTAGTPVLQAPPRPAGAPKGIAFAQQIWNAQDVAREIEIANALVSGNLPPFLLSMVSVQRRETDRTGTLHQIEYWVTPDYLAVGDDSDFLRIPMDPVTAQQMATHFGCLMPTAKMVEQIYAVCALKLPPETRDYYKTAPEKQTTTEAYLEHSQALDKHFVQANAQLGTLVAGHKKDLVIAPSYIDTKARLAFYGWFENGVPIEGNKHRGRATLAHEPKYVDYSHGVRLVAKAMTVDGNAIEVAAVLGDRNLAPLLSGESGEGVIVDPRYTLDRAGNPIP